MKERFTEVAIVVIGGIGLIVLFTLLYAGPRIILERIIAAVRTAF